MAALPRVRFLSEWFGPRLAIGGVAVALLLFTLTLGRFSRRIRRMQ